MEQKKELSSYIQNISLFLLGILFILFPVVFTKASTNPIVLPKQILLGGVVAVLLIFQIVKMFAERSVKLRRSPFDIPIFLLVLFSFLSAMLAVNKADALTAFIPYLLSTLGFYLIVNVAKDKGSLLFLMSSLTIGAVLLSILSILTFFKKYILPFSETHTQTFSPLGTSLEQGMYLITVLAISSYYLYKFLKFKMRDKETAKSAMTNQELTKIISFGAASLIIIMGLVVTAYSIIKLDKPAFLPIEIGFQTAASETFLDSNRLAQGFLLGSGFGTYSVDFSRWKLASFNQYSDLWNLTFFRSSNFAFELLATTGILGLGAFIFLLIRVFKEIRTSSQNKMHFSIIVIFLISLLLPLNFTSQTLLFIVLGLFTVNQGLISKMQNRFFDIELQLVTFKKGLIAIEEPHARNGKSLILPFSIGVVLLALIGIVGFYSIPYVTSDLTFQKSLIATAQNNGSLTYELQRQAIANFPYRDGFYRVFSQTNLALANTLASQQSAGSTPSQDVQQSITKLIQQSIDSARNAATLSPQTALNWQNLSSVYRALIGFGQNAEAFALASAQQSINLDPNNPQEYITMGGIYYQLQQWDNAERQFLAATNLKPDYANSYYNLGHVLEQKKDYQSALTQYQTVRSLVGKDKTSLAQIEKEIAAIQDKAQAQSQQAQSQAQTNNQAATNTTNQPLNINQPEAKLPAQNPPVQILAPPIATPSSISK
jgi:tetratricopeptide (TPR) repeat protein